MAKPATINHSPLVRQTDLQSCVPDLEDWPRRWMGIPQDLPPGQKIVAFFRPFLEDLLRQNLSAPTIRKHATNLWILGGEIIRQLNHYPSLRKKPVKKLVREALARGGFLLYAGDDTDQQRSFDSTCRKFYRFLQEQPP